MRKTSLVLLGATLLATPLAAVAQPAAGPGGQGGGPGGGPRGPGAMFDQVDANRDGRVTWDETWTFVQARFGAADRDGNGGLTQEEMQQAMQALRTARRDAAQQQGQGPGPGPGQGPGRGPRDQEAAAHMGAMFRALDADRNGSVTLVELRPAVEARFRAMDANADNAVDRGEMPQRAHRGPGQGRPGNGPGTAPGAAPANPG
jgi:hypothetical protein